MTTIIRDMPLDVCVDCTMLVANGTLGSEDETADAEHADKMTAALGAEDVKHLVLDFHSCNDGDCGNPECVDSGDQFFSWHPCSGCGSPLGGDRFPARVLHVVP